MLERRGLELRHLIERQVLRHHQRHVRGAARRGGDDALEIFRRTIERAGEEGEARFDARAAPAIEQQEVAGHVLDQRPPLAIEDDAARRLDLELAQPVVLGQLAVVGATHDLRVPVADEDGGEGDAEQHRQLPRALHQQAQAFLVVHRRLLQEDLGAAASAPAAEGLAQVLAAGDQQRAGGAGEGDAQQEIERSDRLPAAASGEAGGPGA